MRGGIRDRVILAFSPVRLERVRVELLDHAVLSLCLRDEAADGLHKLPVLPMLLEENAIETVCVNL